MGTTGCSESFYLLSWSSRRMKTTYTSNPTSKGILVARIFMFRAFLNSLKPLRPVGIFAGSLASLKLERSLSILSESLQPGCRQWTRFRHFVVSLKKMFHNFYSQPIIFSRELWKF